MTVPAIPLNDGNRIPVLAFGTGSKLKGKASNPVLSTDLPPTLFKDVTEIVEQAFDAGFSHIDSAACESVSNFAILVTGRLTLYPHGTVTVVYANEQYIGTAIRDCGLARQELWITTKYDGGDVLGAVHTSLRKVCR
jgi:diketogulonate reductase-like aldo/keto reductase